jgi:hypothetical protein
VGGTYLSASSDQSRVKKSALNAISKEKHSPRRHEGHEEKQKRLKFFWLRETGSWSFQICIPKLELGNEYKGLITGISGAHRAPKTLLMERIYLCHNILLFLTFRPLNFFLCYGKWCAMRTLHG